MNGCQLGPAQAEPQTRTDRLRDQLATLQGWIKRPGGWEKPPMRAIMPIHPVPDTLEGLLRLWSRCTSETLTIKTFGPHPGDPKDSPPLWSVSAAYLVIVSPDPYSALLQVLIALLYEETPEC